MFRPLSVSQSMAVESIDPVTSTSAFGLKQTQTISFKWPLRIRSKAPVRESQIYHSTAELVLV